MREMPGQQAPPPRGWSELSWIPPPELLREWWCLCCGTLACPTGCATAQCGCDDQFAAGEAGFPSALDRRTAACARPRLACEHGEAEPPGRAGDRESDDSGRSRKPGSAMLPTTSEVADWLVMAAPQPRPITPP